MASFMQEMQENTRRGEVLRGVSPLIYCSPPNWPAPPEGWSPMIGWMPDPTWGPAPEGWAFWRMPTTTTGPGQIVCPHCQRRGNVTVKRTNRKRGISGGKATGALLTGGASMLLTGLARKENVTEMKCSNCGIRWDV